MPQKVVTETNNQQQLSHNESPHQYKIGLSSFEIGPKIDANIYAEMDPSTSVAVLTLRVNNEPVEAMARIVRAHKAHDLGREMVATMKAQFVDWKTFTVTSVDVGRTSTSASA